VEEGGQMLAGEPGLAGNKGSHARSSTHTNGQMISRIAANHKAIQTSQ
jgi:hypothetical protein